MSEEANVQRGSGSARTLVLTGAVAAALAVGAVFVTGFAAAEFSEIDQAPDTDSFGYSLPEAPDSPSAVLASAEFFAAADKDSVRILTGGDGTIIWSFYRHDTLCLAVTFEREEAAAMSCETSDAFTDGGIGLRYLTPTSAIEAYLVPDAVAAATGSSVIVIDPLLESRNALVEQPVPGFVLDVLPEVQEDEIPEGLLEVERVDE